MARGSVLLAATSLLFSLVLAEFVARARFFGIDAFCYEQLAGFHGLGASGLIQPATAPELLFELKPDLDTSFKLAAFKTNSAGLRDREYPVAKDAKVFRVAVVGDSYTMGAGVPIENAFHSLLEERLNANGPLHYEFINFGVGGYSLRQYAAVIRHKVLPLHPDLILIGWCGDNDHELEPEERYQQPYQPHPTKSGFFTSYLLWWIRWARESRRVHKADTTYSPAELQYIRSNFDRIRADVDGIPVFVVQLGMRETRGDALRALAEGATFHFADTFPAFAGVNLNEYAIHELDSHPNARANRIFADVALSALQQMGVGRKD